MNKVPVIGILVLMLLVVSGYVASDETQLTRTDNAVSVSQPAPIEHAVRNDNAVQVETAYVDPHVGYYQQHLARLGLAR